MSIPLTRVVALAAVVMFVFLGVVAAMPQRLVVVRTARVGGLMLPATNITADVTRVAAWSPCQPGSGARVGGPIASGEGAQLVWAGGEAKLEESRGEKTVLRCESSLPRADRFTFTLELFDRGGGLTGKATWQGDPDSLGSRMVRLFSGRKDEVGAALDLALRRLSAEIAKEGEELARKKREAEERAAEQARALEAATKAAEDQAAFAASVQEELRRPEPESEAPATAPRPATKEHSATEDD